MAALKVQLQPTGLSAILNDSRLKAIPALSSNLNGHMTKPLFFNNRIGKALGLVHDTMLTPRKDPWTHGMKGVIRYVCTRCNNFDRHDQEL